MLWQGQKIDCKDFENGIPREKDMELGGKVFKDFGGLSVCVCGGEATALGVLSRRLGMLVNSSFRYLPSEL